MVDLLQIACSRLTSLREDFASATVTYRRGGQSVAVAATIGATNFRTIDAEGHYVRQTERDFLIRAAAIDFGAGPIVPTRFDTIDVSVGDLVYRWEVCAPPGEQVFRNSDPHGVTLRIHTKAAGVVE